MRKLKRIRILHLHKILKK